MTRVQAKLAVSSLVSLSPDYPKDDRAVSPTVQRVDLGLLLKFIGFVSVATTPLSLKCLATLLQLGSWKDALAILTPLFTLFPLKDPLESASTGVAAHEACTVQTAHKLVYLFFKVVVYCINFNHLFLEPFVTGF
jgi:hypothetical protein